jgi:hypothetical protein
MPPNSPNEPWRQTCLASALCCWSWSQGGAFSSASWFAVALDLGRSVARIPSRVHACVQAAGTRACSACVCARIRENAPWKVPWISAPSHVRSTCAAVHARQQQLVNAENQWHHVGLVSKIQGVSCSVFRTEKNYSYRYTRLHSWTLYSETTLKLQLQLLVMWRIKATDTSTQWCSIRYVQGKSSRVSDGHVHWDIGARQQLIYTYKDEQVS